MAVYKNKEELMNTDWQAKINEATAAGDMKAAAQYEQARNDKINSSDYTGKQTTTNNYSQYLGNSGSVGGTSSNNPYGYTPQDGTGVYGMPTNNSTVKNYTQNGVTYQTGADMRRNPAYAGQAVASNGYTVFYDDNGYAKMAVKGVADYTPWTDSNVTNGTYGTSGAWTDNNMLTGDELKQIADIRAAMQRGEMTGDQANAAANQIRSRYGYTIDKNGNVTDLLGKSTVDERRQNWGLPVNISNEQQSFLQQMYPDGNSLLDALYSLQTSGTANGAPTWSGSEWDSILEELGQQLLNMNYTDWTQGEQYQALADRYGQQGRMSMQDVLGQISSRTGGLASSYATTAAQQQYNQLMSQLEEAAMDMYNVERSDLYDRANMARQYAQDDYNRYLDEWDQWNTNRNYEYQLSRDAIEDQRYDQEWKYQQDQLARQQAEDKANTMAQYGDFSGYKALGYTDAQIALMEAAYQATQANKRSGARRSGSSGGTTGSITQDYDGLFRDAYNSRDAKSFIANNYKNYGFTKSTGLYDAYTEAAKTPVKSGMEMNADHYRAFAQSIAAQLASGKENAAIGNIDSHWDELSAAQRKDIQALLQKYGFQYEP